MRPFSQYIVSRAKKNGRYVLQDKREPDFESELNLAVSSFYTDEAYHRVFGGGKRLDEKSVRWIFIDLIVGRRLSGRYPLMTMRKGASVKALLAGYLNNEPSKVGKYRLSYRIVSKLPNVKYVANKNCLTETIKGYKERYSAIEDEDYSQRTKAYMQLLRTRYKKASTDPLHFTISMIAVDPEEKGRGHLREMLNRLIGNLTKNTLAEYILVTTYDESKVEMYQHFSFSILEEMESGGMKAWVLKLPLTR